MKKNKTFLLVLFIVFSVILIIPSICKAAEEKKIVYLTFDDGPSPNNTLNILNVLNKNGVRATFFVVGENVKNNPQVLQKIEKSNMSIFPHCNNHNYSKLYSSKEYYFEDLGKCEAIISNILGYNKSMNFVRLPGGCHNKLIPENILNEIKNELASLGVNYIDWTLDSGDTSAVRVSADNIENNIRKYAGTYKVEVLLMHDLDNKDTTTEALDEIIKDYKEKGYCFKVLDEIEPWEKEYLKRINVMNM